MPVTNTEIDRLNHDIEKTKEAISSLYIKLGQVACPYHKAINYTASDDSYKLLCVSVSKKNEIEQRIKVVKDAISQREVGGKLLEQGEMTAKDLDLRLDTLTSSLGAVSYEIYKNGKLPQDFEASMSIALEYEKKIEELAKSRDSSKFSIKQAVYQKLIDKAKQNMDKVFFEVGKTLCQQMNLSKIPGDRAAAIIEEMDNVRRLKKENKAFITKKSQSVSNAENFFKNKGISGFENKTLRELENSDEIIISELQDLFKEYGEVLSRGMNSWLDSKAPKELQDCCDKIKTEQKRLKKQKLELDFLNCEREIDIQSSLKARYMDQMKHLENQQLLIERQMEELKKRQQTADETVSEIRKRQSDINTEMSGIEL